MIRKNEFGEEISEKELTDFSRRIRKLPDEKIDELWYCCGFIISDREEKFKAIRQMDLNKIKISLNLAKEVVWNLILETPINDFKKNLISIENKLDVNNEF